MNKKMFAVVDQTQLQCHYYFLAEHSKRRKAWKKKIMPGTFRVCVD